MHIVISIPEKAKQKMTVRRIGEIRCLISSPIRKYGER
jgi:hypothetical protein